MKTIFRLMGAAVLLSGFAAMGAFAQDDACADIDGATAKYDAFTAGYNKNDVAALKSASSAGKEFLEKWGACESWKDQVAFVKPWISKVDKKIEELEFAPTFTRFDKGVESDNIDEAYAAGKLILAKYPTNNNVKYVMAVMGLQDVSKAAQTKAQSKYASETLSLARSLYDGIKSGSVQLDRKLKDGTPSIGVLKHETTKEEALSRLLYTMGYVNYYGLNNKKAAVPLYYEVTQIPGYFKGYPPVYATISNYYVTEAEGIGGEIVTLTNEYNTLVDNVKKAPAGTSEEEIKRLDTEIKAKDAQIKAKEALFYGYIERAMDAMGRAWNVAKSGTPAEKQYKDGLYKDLEALYKRRFPAKEAGLSEWVASATAKPLPDPTSAVQPVVDAEPTTTTTTGVGAANGTGVGAANGTGVGAANGTGVGTAAKPAATSKVVAKKP